MKQSHVTESIKLTQKEVNLELASSLRWGTDDRRQLFKKRIRQQLPELSEACSASFAKSMTLQAALEDAEMHTELTRIVARLVKLQSWMYQSLLQGDSDAEEFATVAVLRSDYHRLWHALAERNVDYSNEQWLNEQLRSYVTRKVIPPIKLTSERSDIDRMIVFHVSIPLFEDE